MKNKKQRFRTPAEIIRDLVNSGELQQFIDGGQLLDIAATGANFIPGAGPAVSAGLNIVGDLVDAFKKEPPSPLSENSNPFNYKDGGEFNWKDWSGAKGDRKVQELLKARGYYDGPIKDRMDRSVGEAVRRFQKDNNLTVDGIAGKNTISALVVSNPNYSYNWGQPTGQSQMQTSKEVLAGDSPSVMREATNTASLPQNLVQMAINPDPVTQYGVELGSAVTSGLGGLASLSKLATGPARTMAKQTATNIAKKYRKGNLKSWGDKVNPRSTKALREKLGDTFENLSESQLDDLTRQGTGNLDQWVNFPRSVAKEVTGMRQGGEVTGFKQYNAPSHEMGGATIGPEGNLTTTNPAAEIEGTENKYTYSRLPGKQGKTYIFSDANGTSTMVKDIVKQFKKGGYNPDLDGPTKNHMEHKISQVESLNEITNQVKDYMQMRYGGKYQNGGPFDTSFLEDNRRELAAANKEYIARNPLGNINIQSRPRANDPFITSDIASGITAPIQSREVQLGLPNDLPTDKPMRSMDPYDDASYDPDLSGLGQGIMNVASGIGSLSEGITSVDPNNVPIEGTNKIGLDEALRAGALAFNATQLFSSPENEQLVSPNYGAADEQMKRMSADLTQARQDALATSNLAGNLNRNAASSYSQFRGRQLANLGNLSDQLGRIGAQEQSLKNTIAGTRGQYEANKAVDLANRRYQNQINNAQNRAANRNMKRAVVSDFLAEADRLSTIKSNKAFAEATTKEALAILKNKYPDFQVNENMVTELQRLARGEITPEQLSEKSMEILKFRS